MFVDFSDIKVVSKLFTDYIADFGKVRKFYEKSFVDENYCPLLFEKLTSNRNNYSKIIAEEISKEYSGKNISDLTKRNLNLLQQSNSIVIATEIKPSMFGGELKNVFKIITSIKLAEKLSKQYGNYNFIPVAFLLTEENDFYRASVLELLDKDSDVVRLNYDDGLPPEVNRGRLGKMFFKSSISSFFEQFKNLTDYLPFAEYALSILSGFREGKTFADGIKELYFELFDDYGILLFDSDNPRTKKLLIEIFRKEIENFELHSEDAVFCSADVEENYEATVKVRPVNLKMTYKKGLFAVEPEENGFRLKRRKQRFSKEELLQLVNEQPELFTPTTMLTTVCESHLFPLAFIVADDFETNSFAQTFSLFKFFDVNKPLIFPSASATLSEFDLTKLLSEIDLDVADLFLTEEDLKLKIFQVLNGNGLENIFNASQEEINQAISKLGQSLSALGFSAEKEIGEMEKVTSEKFNGLKTKVFEFLNSEAAQKASEISKLRKPLFPDGTLQEKKVALIYYIAKYGEDFVPWLFDQLRIDVFKHQIIEI